MEKLIYLVNHLTEQDVTRLGFGDYFPDFRDDLRFSATILLMAFTTWFFGFHLLHS